MSKNLGSAAKPLGTITATELKDANGNNLYLPIGGGVLTGNKVSRNVNDNFLRLTGGSDWDKGAYFYLYGKDHSNSGEFLIGAYKANGGKALNGKPDGTLTWAGKAVAVAGDYLPISGGAISGEITRDRDDSALTIRGGADGANCAMLDLCGKKHPLKGSFIVTASDGTATKELRGNVDGTLTWGGSENKVLTSAGGTISGSIKFLTDGNISIGKVEAGDNFLGEIDFIGTKKSVTYGGGIQIVTKKNDGSNGPYIDMRKDGTLRWNDNDLSGTAIVAKSLGQNGYIRYASGLIIQWLGEFKVEDTNHFTKDFPISFSGSTIYGLSVISTNNNVDTTGWDSSSVALHASQAPTYVKILAIGY